MARRREMGSGGKGRKEGGKKTPQRLCTAPQGGGGNLVKRAIATRRIGHAHVARRAVTLPLALEMHISPGGHAVQTHRHTDKRWTS